MANIANTTGALQSVSDFRTMKTTEGELMLSGAEQYMRYRANAAVTKGQALAYVVPTQTVPLSVTPMATASIGSLFAGIATEAAAAGDVVNICKYGVVDVFVNAQTAAYGEILLKPATNAGEATRSATALDATTVTGTVLGLVLAAKNATTLLAPCFINQL